MRPAGPRGRVGRQRGKRGKRRCKQDRQDAIANKGITIPPKADLQLLTVALEVNMDPWAGLSIATTNWAEPDNDSNDHIVFPHQVNVPCLEGSHVGDSDALSTISPLQAELEAAEPVWILYGGATEHLTLHRPILQCIHCLDRPQVFGLASDTGTMQAVALSVVDLALP